MLTGRPPFLGDSTYATLMQVLGHEPAPLRSLRPQAPAALEAVCRRCLAKDPRERYPDASALADDLERRWKQATQGARFARLALLAAVALVVLQLVQPLLVGRPSADPGTLEGAVSALLPLASPLHDAAGVLDRLLRGLVVVGGPLLGSLGLVLWSSAWCWYAERRIVLAIGWAVVALAVLYGWLFALGIPNPATGFLPWALVANAFAKRRPVRASRTCKNCSPRAPPPGRGSRSAAVARCSWPTSSWASGCTSGTAARSTGRGKSRSTVPCWSGATATRRRTAPCPASSSATPPSWDCTPSASPRMSGSS
jgi:hypothetical protein